MPTILKKNKQLLCTATHLFICVLISTTLLGVLYYLHYSSITNRYKHAHHVRTQLKRHLLLISTRNTSTQHTKKSIQNLPILLRLHLNQNKIDLTQKTLLLAKEIKRYQIKLNKLTPIEPNTIQIKISAPFSSLINFIIHVSHAPPLLWLQQISLKLSQKANNIILTAEWRI